MPAPDPTAPLQAAVLTLHSEAVQAMAVRSTQVWVADDLGFHPRAVQGRPCDDQDRACARQCCIQGQLIAQDNLLAVPLLLTDQSHGACLFDWPEPHDAAQLQWLSEQVRAANTRLDTALHSERLERLSGLARKSDLLRATLTLAHSLEHSADLRATIAELQAEMAAESGSRRKSKRIRRVG